MRKLFLLVAVLALALPTFAFAQEATPEATEEAMVEPIELPAVDPLSVTGDVITAGSSTVFPLAERIAEDFQNEGFAGEVTIDSIGSGAGFERFCEAGETDVSNASRAIKDDEIAACAALTPPRTPIEFRVGTDALTVVVSTENDFVTDLSIEQLAAIFSGEAATWADVDPSYPAEPIQLFSPGTDSGTFDFFVEVVFADLEADAREQAILNAPGIQLSEDDNVLVQGVLGSPYAIGYFGFAYYNENQDTLKAVAVDGVEPNEQTAEDNSYPLSRPLFIYSDATVLQEKPQVAAYINYFLSNVNDVIVEVGYFPASVEALNQAKQNWLDAVGEGM
jgi:phosphate transport system substrate-binding protein